MTPEKIEAAAAAMWRAETIDAGTPKSVIDNRTPAAFAEESPKLRARWHKIAQAGLEATQRTQELSKQSLEGLAYHITTQDGENLKIIEFDDLIDRLATTKGLISE
jgi:hypothetical protein